MYLLYGSNGSGSASVEAALALSGAEYQVVQTPTAEGMHLTEDFKAINPRQQVPALRLPRRIGDDRRLGHDAAPR